MNENIEALRRYKLVPRMLVDVSRLDTACRLFGRALSMPVLVAPMAMQRMAHPEGELGMARACRVAGVPMCVSTMATHSVEEVGGAWAAAAALPGAPAVDPGLWFQLYVVKDRAFTYDLVRSAEKAGYTALVVTVDVPVAGRREADERNGFCLPDGVRLANIERLEARQRGGGGGGDAASSGLEAESGSGLARFFAEQADNTLTWAFVRELKRVTGLPVLVKGVLSPGDAALALEAGCDGIVLSNHGGRQLDHAISAFDALPHVARAVGGRVPVLADGGVRSGTDVVKALALGADAVMVGRPMLWSLALGGAAGVAAGLGMLRDELRRTMALCGLRTAREVRSDAEIVRAADLHAGVLQRVRSRL